MTHALFNALGASGIALAIASFIVLANYIDVGPSNRNKFYLWMSIAMLVVGPTIATFFFTLAQGV